jgi:hypothetical protein
MLLSPESWQMAYKKYDTIGAGLKFFLQIPDAFYKQSG